MHLLVLSFNHRQTPFDLLSKIAVSASHQPHMLECLFDHPTVHEVVALCTCNRTEVYFVAENAEETRRHAIRTLSMLNGVDPAELSHHAVFLEEMEVRRHLLCAASGIDSLVVGELEILGQIRKAWELARKLHKTGGQLSDLFQRAIQFGRRVRRLTNISQGNVSIASAAFHLIRQTVPELGNSRVLLVGSGEVCQRLLFLLNEHGAATMMLVNRSFDKAELLADRVGGRPVPFDDLADALGEADIVLCATSSPHPVVVAEMVAAAPVAPRGRVFMDLSVPANIDPAVRKVPGNKLFTIGDLRAIAEENAEKRQQEVRKVMRLIDDEIEAMRTCEAMRERQRLIRDFRLRMETIRQRHLADTLGKYGSEERASLDRYSRSLVSALLHDIVGQLRRNEGSHGDEETLLRIAREVLLGGDQHSQPLPPSAVVPPNPQPATGKLPP